MSVARGDTWCNGVNGFLPAHHLHDVYYLILFAILAGMFVIIACLAMHKWLNRRKDAC